MHVAIIFIFSSIDVLFFSFLSSSLPKIEEIQNIILTEMKDNLVQQISSSVKNTHFYVTLRMPSLL